jgi:hypothetical protein
VRLRSECEERERTERYGTTNEGFDLQHAAILFGLSPLGAA